MESNTLEEAEESVYDIRFVALVPTESAGQVAWDGSRNDLIAALENYLVGLYGPNKFKVTAVDLAADISDTPLIHIPPIPIQSKQEH